MTTQSKLVTRDREALDACFGAGSAQKEVEVASGVLRCAAGWETSAVLGNVLGEGHMPVHSPDFSPVQNCISFLSGSKLVLT